VAEGAELLEGSVSVAGLRGGLENVRLSLGCRRVREHLELQQTRDELHIDGDLDQALGVIQVAD